MEKNEVDKKVQEAGKPKKSKKIIVILATMLLILILLGIIALQVYYFLRNEEDKIKEIYNQQEEAFLDNVDNINYGNEFSYEDLQSKFVNIDKLKENTKISIEINDKTINKEEMFKFDTLGVYKIKIKLEYTYNYSLIKSISKQIENEKIIEINILDTEKPTISGVSNKEITIGDEINLLDGITAADNVDGDIQVSIEGSVDNTKAGEYNIKVIATDKSGNTQEATFVVTVKEKAKVQTSTNNSNRTNNNSNNSTTQNSGGGNTTQTRKEFTKQELLVEANNCKSTYRSLINRVLNSTNTYRQQAGVSNLVLNEELTTAACARAVEMAYSGILSHTRPNGTDCFTILDDINYYSYFTCGENIAWGQTTPESATGWWRNSPGHYANMISSYFKKIGIGVCRLNGGYYWVQLFTD